MRYFGFTVALLALASVSNAQFLRASSFASVSSADGNNFQTNEQAWMMAAAGTSLNRSANALVTASRSGTSFTSEFGTLKGSTYASLNTTGTGYASSRGLFDSFNSFVGAGFFDTVTLTGSGVVSLTINYSLHSVNVDPNDLTFARTQLSMATFSTVLGNQTPGALDHLGAGEQHSFASITVTGTAGQKFDLLGEMSSLSSVSYTAGNTGLTSASSNAMNTGSVWITATSGGYTTASGSEYAAPVPEPASLSVIGLGALALLRRRRSSKN